MGIALRQLGISFVSRIVASLHDRLREWTQLGARGDEPLHRLWIEHVVFGRHPCAGLARAGLYHRLISLRQVVPFGEIDQKMRLRAALPPTGVARSEEHTS